MKRVTMLAAVTLLWCLFHATSARADLIDFESQAHAGTGLLTGIPDSPLTIAIATLTGGELLRAESGLPADATALYATEGLFGVDSNPLIITFAKPVNSFSILIANGDSQNQSYTLSDDLGETVTKQLALPGAASGSTATLTLPGSGITRVTVASANPDFWNFAIDDVSFTATAAPEPGTWALCAASLLFFLTYWKRHNDRSEL
jgi:hypothetical protein